MADEEDIAALVIDNGSGMCKGKFRCWEVPLAVAVRGRKRRDIHRAKQLSRPWTHPAASWSFKISRLAFWVLLAGNDQPTDRAYFMERIVVDPRSPIGTGGSGIHGGAMGSSSKNDRAGRHQHHSPAGRRASWSSIEFYSDPYIIYA